MNFFAIFSLSAVLPVFAMRFRLTSFLVLLFFGGFVVAGILVGSPRGFDVNIFTESGDVQRVFMSGVSFRFGYSLRRTDNFLNGRLVLGILGRCVF